MFIGRERELATLNKLYESDKFEFVVIYGRRRVGKTALISQFIDDKTLFILWVSKAMPSKILKISARVF